MRVGLFDSGIGGLTVLKKLRLKYPCNDYIYYGDTLNVPYGNKSVTELKKLAKRNCEFLINKKVDMIIIACGTVSSNCLDYLKQLFDIPIFSVVEPTIKYLLDTDYDNIGVIATKATINSHIFKNNLENKHVYEIATPVLASLIEANELDDIDHILHGYLDKYKNKFDILVLGCTHYPLIKNEISRVLNNKVTILDMADLVTLENDGNSLLEIHFSKTNDDIMKKAKDILKSS